MAISDAHMFPGFLTPVLTQLFFPKPPTTFLTCFCRDERRKYDGKKVRLNRGSNSQPPGHVWLLKSMHINVYPRGSTLTQDRPTLSACCSVRSGWTRQIQARLVVLLSNQHSSFINSFIYDCKLSFLLVVRMVVLNDCLLFYHIRYGRACITSPGNPA